MMGSDVYLEPLKLIRDVHGYLFNLHDDQHAHEFPFH